MMETSESSHSTEKPKSTSSTRHHLTDGASVLLKLIDIILPSRRPGWVTSKRLLSPCQISFEPGCSLCFANIFLESRMRHAQVVRYMSALVGFNVAKAYGTVENTLRK